MPYKQTKKGRLVNEVTLGDGYPLSNDLQPLKVGGKASVIEISNPLPDNSNNGKVVIKGDLEVTGNTKGIGSSSDSNTTYTVSCVDGDNSDEEKIRLTGSDSSTDDVVLEAGTGLSIARSGDKITFTNTVSDTDTNTNQLTVWNYSIDGGSTVDVAHGQTLSLSSGEGIDISEDSPREFTIDCENASTTNKGVVELATTAETTTGTDTSRAVTPDGLKDSGYMGFEFRHIINAGFNYSYTAGTKVYIPLVGYTLERNSQLFSNEFLSYVAPYDGYLNQVVFRSEEACGSTVVGFHKSTTGTESPSATASATVTVDMATDDTSYKFGFSSNNTFSAGDIINISFDPTNDANDVNFTAEFILDSSSGL